MKQNIGNVLLLAVNNVSGGAGIEDAFTILVSWVKLGLEIVSALMVLIGAFIAAYQLFKMLLSKSPMTYYQRLRLTFSRSLILALEFQLAADIIGTTVAPTWEQLGKLGAIAVIRTFLNYFLGREVKEIEIEEEKSFPVANKEELN